MLEIIAGSFALFLGWLCIDHVSRVRALYSEERPRHSLFHGEKPLMIIPAALGLLLALVGLALLTFAVVEWLRLVDTAGSLGVVAALALVRAGCATSTSPPGRQVNPVACVP